MLEDVLRRELEREGWRVRTPSQGEMVLACAGRDDVEIAATADSEHAALTELMSGAGWEME